MVQAGFTKGRGTRNQIADILWIIEKAREFQENICFCFIDYGEHDKLENSSRDGNNRPPDLPPEKSVCRSRSNRTGHGTTDWFQIGKGIRQGCILSPTYLTYMQSTSCKMLGWMKHKLEPRFGKKYQ